MIDYKPFESMPTKVNRLSAREIHNLIANISSDELPDPPQTRSLTSNAIHQAFPIWLILSAQQTFILSFLDSCVRSGHIG